MKPTAGKQKKSTPWVWIPSLYFAEGLPYVAVMIVSLILFKRMGISNTDATLYTGWLNLPWVIKPLWSPFVEILKTKRWWITTMQLLIGAGLAGVAFMIPVPFFFQATLSFFWLLAFSSATHDIAADGFYMIALDTHNQAKFVGIRSTFYRIAVLSGQGLLVILAGALESSTGLEPLEIPVHASTGALPYTVSSEPYTLTPELQGDHARFIAFPAEVTLSTDPIPADSAAKLKTFANEQNILNGFTLKPDEEKKEEKSWWHKHVSGPLGGWIKAHFGEMKESLAQNTAGNVALVQVRLSHRPEPGEKRVLVLSLKDGDKSIAQKGGERFEFTEANWDKPLWIPFQLDVTLTSSSQAVFKGLSGNIPLAWSVSFFILAGIFIALFVYHRFALPQPAGDKAGVHVTASGIFKEFFHTFGTFFKKKQVWAGLFFMFTYRFAEAQLLKMVAPFILDPKEAGGLGLTTGQLGMVYGTIGIICLTVGGIIGGFVVARGGLRKWLWPMALSMILTCATFMYLSYYQPDNLWVINFCVGLEQFGYGFGFTAYVMYLMYYAEGEHKTSHYAICTGIMALGLMLPGMMAGWLQELIGYPRFFEYVMICSVIPLLATALLKIDPEYGKAEPKEK